MRERDGAKDRGRKEDVLVTQSRTVNRQNPGANMHERWPPYCLEWLVTSI